MSRVADLMVSGAVTANVDAKVSDVAKQLAANDVGAVLVVAGDELIGVFSERDLAVRVVAEGRDPQQTAVADVASVRVVSVTPDESLRSALAKFRLGRFRHLPVVADGKPVGIVSTRDLLVAGIEKLEGFIEQAGFDQKTEAGVDPYDHFGGSYGK